MVTNTMPEVLTIDQDMAREILRVNKYEGQRPLSYRHVLFLAGEMERDNFQSHTNLVFCQSPERRVLVDGYQRLNALIHCGKPQVFTITVLPVESDDEIKKIYMRLDQGRKRSFSDTFNASNLYRESGFDRTNLNKLGSAVRWLIQDFSSPQKRLPLDVHEEALREHLPLYREYYDLITGIHMPEHIRRRFTASPLIAIAIATLKYQHSSAVEFWGGAALDDGLTAGDPRKAFLKFMDKYALGRTRDSRQYMPPLEYLKYTARIWNAWFAGDKLSHLRRQNSVPGPTELNGTPYVIGQNQGKG